MTVDTTEGLLLLYTDAFTNSREDGCTPEAVVDGLESAYAALDDEDELPETLGTLEPPTADTIADTYASLAEDGYVFQDGDTWSVTDDGEGAVATIRSEFADGTRPLGSDTILWLEALVAELERRDDEHPELVDVLRSLGTAYSNAAADDTAVEVLERAHELAETLDDSSGAVGAQIDLGRAYEAAGEFEAAGDQYRSANYAASEAGLDRAAANARTDLGTIMYQTGTDLDDVRSTLEKAIEAYQSIDDPLGECSVHRLLTTVCYDDGAFDAAIDHAERALSLADEIEDEAEAAFERGLVQIALGRVYTDTGSLDQAIELFEDGIDAIDDDSSQALRAHLWLADALTEADRIDDATAQIDAAEAIVETGTIPEELETLVTLRRGRIEHANGDHDAAKTLYREASGQAEEIPAFRTIALSYYFAGLIDLETDNEFYANERLGRARYGGKEYGEWDIARKADDALDAIEE